MAHSAGLTWCLQQHWTLVFNISFTNFGISNNIPLTAMYCIQPVTPEFGLRKIPLGYLCSADWAQSYSVFLDPLLIKMFIVLSLGQVDLFFFFHLLPDSSVSPTSTHCIITLPHALALPIAHWLPTVPTLPDFDLCLVELNIDDMTQRTRCDCDIDVYILFFLIFFIKLLFWWWRLISPFYYFVMTVLYRCFSAKTI